MSSDVEQSPTKIEKATNIFLASQEASAANIDCSSIRIKTALVDPDEKQYDLLHQYLKQRLDDGNGETIFDIGLGEDGGESGLKPDEYDASLATLQSLASTLGADCVLLRQRKMEQGQTGQYLVRRRVDIEDFMEIRVAVVGNVDAGKSTLLGVLTHGELDNGRGHARQRLFRHKHEMESGRTSSVGNDILGFDSCGNIVNKPEHGSLDWVKICEKSSKVITFIDLAGHERYLKTTVFGMTGHAPDFGMLMYQYVTEVRVTIIVSNFPKKLVQPMKGCSYMFAKNEFTLWVGANAGIVGMTKEHLGLALALSVPVFVVVTKIDMCPPNVLQDTLKLLVRILKSPGCRKVPVMVKSGDDVIISATNFVSESPGKAKQYLFPDIKEDLNPTVVGLCPIFQVSNVTGENLELLKMFLNLLMTRQVSRDDEPAEFQIDDLYSVPGVGTVVSGTTLKGVIRLNDTLLLGPDPLGHFIPIAVKSIHRKRMVVREVRGGQTASFALKKIKRNALRKGMVMVSPALNPKACWEFEGEILVLHHPTTISTRYQAMVHCGSIRQTASILSMSQDCLRTGDKALVHFRFIKHPEYIKAGQRMVFREGRTKAVGNVLRIIPQANPGAQMSRSKPNKMQSRQQQASHSQQQQQHTLASSVGLPQAVEQLSSVGVTDADSPFEVTADKRENMPQRSGRKSRGRRGGRGRSGGQGASAGSSAGGPKPLGEQNPVATRPNKA